MMPVRRGMPRPGLGNERGSILTLTMVCTIALLGMVGLALDSGNLYHHRRVEQTAADAGAMAGAAEIFRGRTDLITSSALAATSQNGFTDGVESVDVTVYRPPVSGYHTGDQRFVEVLVTHPAPVFLMQLFGWNSVQIPARAVAGAAANSRNCIYVLDPSETAALLTQSAARVTANCGVVVNSRDSRAAIFESASILTASDVSITGGYELNGGASTVTPTPQTGVPRSIDPLAYLPAPTVPAGCTATQYVLPTGSATINPGVYCDGIEIQSNAHLTLNPGLYILKGGGLKVQSASRLTGNGVTIYNTQGGGFQYDTIEFQSSGVITLSAPTTGTYAGILFFQDRSAGSGFVNEIQSSTNSTFEGALYFPTQKLVWQSSANTLANYTSIVARLLEFQSSAQVTLNNNYSGLPGGNPIKRLSLVE